MNTDYKEIDVLVIGAGPSGCIAASLLNQQGLRVRVVEREKFPRFVIGESLLPRCMEALEEAGFLEALKRKGFQEKFGARFIKEDRVADYFFADQFTEGWSWTWQVPRAEFDMTIANELQNQGVPIDFQSTVTCINFNADGSSETCIQTRGDKEEIVKARFIVDGSGYGRVIPRLLDLDRPSELLPRKAVFGHITDSKRSKHDDPDRILIITYAPGVWVWVIPFSNGITSLGFVANVDFFSDFGDSENEILHNLISSHPYLKKRFANESWHLMPRHLQSWSISSQTYYGNGFVLVGNATDFLDPVFSSGVMFATVSAQVAARLVAKKMKNEVVDWEHEYAGHLRQGIGVFRSYVNAWYDGTLDSIFYADNPDLEIKRQICSVLAGYVWDQNNPYVKNHTTALRQLAKMITYRDRETI